MKYGKIGGVTDRASRIIFGCGTEAMWKGGDADEALSCALENGINIYDTARVYGESEKTLGRWLTEQNRKEIIVETKCCHFDLETGSDRVDRESALSDIKTSLDMLKTDYADILLLHRDNPEKEVGEIISFMNEIVDKGYARAIGASNWRAGRIAQANGYAEKHGLIGFCVSSPHYGQATFEGDSYGHGCISVSGKNAAAEREFYLKEQMPLFCYSSLAGGLFSGKYTSAELKASADGNKNTDNVFLTDDNIERLKRAEILAEEKDVGVSEIALGWIFCDKMNTFAITGSGSEKHILKNIRSVRISLSEKERDWLSLKSENR